MATSLSGEPMMNYWQLPVDILSFTLRSFSNIRNRYSLRLARRSVLESDEQKPAKFWDQHYGASAQVWSGQVNAALAEIAADLRPGTALDLGSGEGADVIWLAQHGWQATGVDVSSLAVQRARYAASAQGLSGQQAQFIVADIAKWQSLQTFDLVAPAILQAT